jgi:plastocyanin
MKMSRWLAIAALAAATGCSSSTSYGTTPPPPPPPPGGGHSTTITVSNNVFSPTPDTINAGTITFHWAANAIQHNVTWTGGPTTPANSGNKIGGDADYQALLQAGTYTYHCTNHSTMTGQIVVLP